MNGTWPKTLPLEEIKQLVQERLALPEGWETHTASLETRVSGKKVWNLKRKARDKDREVNFWVSVDARPLPSAGLNREEALKRTGEIMDWLIGTYEVIQVEKSNPTRPRPARNGARLTLLWKQSTACRFIITW